MDEVKEPLTQLTPRMVTLIERKLKDRMKTASREKELERKHSKARPKAKEKAKRARIARRGNRCK